MFGGAKLSLDSDWSDEFELTVAQHDTPKNFVITGKDSTYCFVEFDLHPMLLDYHDYRIRLQNEDGAYYFHAWLHPSGIAFGYTGDSFYPNENFLLGTDVESLPTGTYEVSIRVVTWFEENTSTLWLGSSYSNTDTFVVVG